MPIAIQAPKMNRIRAFAFANPELTAEQIAQRRVHHMALQPFEHDGIEHVAPDGAAIVAGAFIARGRAAEALGTKIGETTTTAAAAHQPR